MTTPLETASIREALDRLPPDERAACLAGMSPRARAEVDSVLIGAQVEADGWERWLDDVLPAHTGQRFAKHHRTFWEWAWQIPPTGAGVEYPPALLFWPRGHAKSTSIEAALVMVGARRLRRYALYICHTQDQADDHVQNVAGMLESDTVARHYPTLGERSIGAHGNSRGWRRNRVRTASGLTVDAIGLDTAARGVKLDDTRPDVIVFDDIDHEHDTPNAVAKKVRTITQALLPAGTDDAVVILGQNLVHPGSIARQLADGSLDMLGGALRIGPLPAVDNLVVTQDETGLWRITDGHPTWHGMDLDACEQRINRYGLSAFLLESQQEVSQRDGAIWTRDLIDAHRIGKAPHLDRIVVGVDPNKTGRGDDAGVVVVGVATPPGAALPHAYVLADATQQSKPDEWRDDAAEMLLTWNAGSFVVERTGLGDHAELTLRDAPALAGRPVDVVGVEAKISKQDRARPVRQLYDDGRIHHVGSFPTLETQQTSWVPGVGRGAQSPGGIDALVHAVTHLLIDTGGPVIVERVSGPRPDLRIRRH